MVFGVHFAPVRSDAAAPETRNTLFLSRTISFTASATEDVGTSTITSTLSTSIHVRTTLEPTSGLFWWSALTISTFMPLAAAPKSSTAISAATTEPWPIRPFMAFSPVGRLFVVCTPAFRVPSFKSHPQVIVDLVKVGLELGVGEPVDNATVLHDVIAIGDRRSEAKILLDQEYGEALLLEHVDGLADLLNDDGRQTLGGLVEQQEPGSRAQDSADGQHLLLAARKLRSLAGQALLEVGK